MGFDTRLKLKPLDFSDTGNSSVFVRECGADIKYTSGEGWKHWTGTHWETDEDAALKAAKIFTEKMLEEARAGDLAKRRQLATLDNQRAAGDEQDPEAVSKARKEAKAAADYLAHARASRSGPRTREFIRMARADLTMPLTAFDADPFVLNTPGGLVNLITGEMKPHNREAYCTKITRVSPGDQGREKWLDQVNLVTCGDLEYADFLQVFHGSTLFGKVFEERAVFEAGDGNNGKSTFENAIKKALGSYAGGIDVDILAKNRRVNVKAELATLRGLRFVVGAELEKDFRISSAVLKRLCSTDTIRAEEKFKQPFDFEPSHSLLIFTNPLPRITDTDSGTWRRILILPFNAKITPQNDVKNYGGILANECGPFILSWMIEGARRFARNGFRLGELPTVVKMATEQYKHGENIVYRFIDTACVLSPTFKTGARDLYNAFCEWAANSGEEAITEKEFAAAMFNANFKQTKPGNKRTWNGLKVNQSAQYKAYTDRITA